MKEKSYSITPFWDKRTIDSKSKSARIMLTINLERKQFRISLKMRSTKEDFDKAVSGQSGSEAVRVLRSELQQYITKGEKIFEMITDPTKETFLRIFKMDTPLSINNKTPALPFFQIKIAELHKEERFSSCSKTKLALSSLMKYKPELFFEEMDIKFLKGYVSFMVSSGNSVTTANMYLRTLSGIFNEVIKAGIVSEKHYHFKGLKMGSRVRSKAVLYPEQLKALLDYETVGIREARAKAYFFFCYLSNGMNPKDMFMLKWKNIQGNMLTFVRHKTRNTTLDTEKEIKVYLHDLSKHIIKQCGSVTRNQDDFVFTVCKRGMTAEQMNSNIIRAKRVSNKMLSAIGKKLGFEVHCCLGISRHSFATKLKIDNKVSIAAISDALGHTTTNTTMHYMKSLPDEFIKEMSSDLLVFNSTPKLLAV